MTLTPRPFFWSVRTRAGRELAAGVGAPGYPLPREHDVVRAAGALWNVAGVEWTYGDAGGPITVAVVVQPVGAMYEADARRS